MAMFEVTLTIQDLDVGSAEQAVQVFRDCIEEGLQLYCSVKDENGAISHRVELPAATPAT